MTASYIFTTHSFLNNQFTCKYRNSNCGSQTNLKSDFSLTNEDCVLIWWCKWHRLNLTLITHPDKDGVILFNSKIRQKFSTAGLWQKFLPPSATKNYCRVPDFRLAGVDTLLLPDFYKFCFCTLKFKKWPSLRLLPHFQ